jgi:fumarylacetoacetase
MTPGMTRLAAAAGSLFGVHNLPYGAYSVPGAPPRIATRLGDHVIDLGALLGKDGDNAVFAEPTLNSFMAQGPHRWAQVRAQLREAVTRDVADAAVHPLSAVTLHMPFTVADYVDFYASEHHAAALGRLFRPGSPEPLNPNWKHLPVGYHGRSAGAGRPSLPRPGTAVGPGHRLRSRVERRGGYPPALCRDVLVPRADARPPHLQRRPHPDW